jgi:hypothetical protein
MITEAAEARERSAQARSPVAVAVLAETAMTLEFLWKDSDSGGGGCPSLYRAPGGYVVQGVRIDAQTRADLRQLAADEDAVFVPANVLDRLAIQAQ